MDVGNDLNIASLQDSDNYNYKKTSASAGVSIPVYGYGNFQANASASKTKMNSNWSSVTDQSGVFAGNGGFDITVNNNSDIKGAVIASDAEDKTKNRLDTGTISFSDIENKADYSVKSSSISISAGKGIPTASPPTAYQHKDKDHSTTHSAVEEGVIIIRDKDKQQQDINTLSRDTTNANNELAPIFDKQKELDRIEKIELVADIASQAKDLAQKYSRMQAEEKYKALSPEEKDDINKKIRKELEGRGVDFSEYNEEGKQAVIRDEYIRQVSQREGIGNMGDGFSKGIDAATSIVIGIIKGDITGGLAGASAPYLATLIKEQTGHYDAASKTWITDNKEANLIAHAILGAVVAELQGNSGLSGGIGAVTGEVAAEFMAKHIYGKDVKDLTEAEKRNISSLAQLASGLAVASVGGNTGDIAAAIASSKNAAENNYLSPEEAKEKLTLETFINTKKGDEKQTVLNRIAELNKINEERDAALKEACANKTSAECASHIDLLKNYLNNYEQARSTYPFIDLTPEDRKKVESYLNSYAPSHWDYAIANYAKDHDISIEEATAKFKPAMYSEKFAVIAATYYGMKGIGNLGKGSVIDNLKATVKKADDALIVGKGTTGTNVIAQGESGLVGSKVIQPNTTVKLTESTKLPNGEIVPKGSTVTVSDNTMKITYPDGTSKISNYNKAMSSPSALPRQKTINPATNKVVTEHIVVSSGRAPKTSTPNSIYEVSRADGTRSITYYDDKGRTFSREDYGQQKTHGQLGYDANGKVPPHEHKITYNERGYVDKHYYRELDVNGKPVGPWILDKK